MDTKPALSDETLNALAMKNSYVMEEEIPMDIFFPNGHSTFMPYNNDDLSGIESDGHGGWWALIARYPAALIQIGSSAKLSIQGNEIAIAARCRLSNQAPCPVPPHEAPILYIGDWEAITGLKRPKYCNLTAGFFAVKLPFKPARATLSNK